VFRAVNERNENKGFSKHDLDIVVRMTKRKTVKQLGTVCEKWNKLFTEKYGFTLDVIILTEDKNTRARKVHFTILAVHMKQH